MSKPDNFKHKSQHFKTEYKHSNMKYMMYKLLWIGGVVFSLLWILAEVLNS